MSSKIWGYVRTSRTEQKTDRQVDLLMKEYGIPEEDIFIDSISGTKFDRPELGRLQSVLRDGDTVVVESLSRVSRSSKDLLTLLEDWQKGGSPLFRTKRSSISPRPRGSSCSPC